MNRLGMALAILVWNTLSCLTGWATSSHGVYTEENSYKTVFRGVMYMFVKSNTQNQSNAVKDIETPVTLIVDVDQ
ncbi:hypothetical protein COOONC_20486 [Cooperia oncophora]